MPGRNIVPLALSTPGLPLPTDDFLFTPVPIGQRLFLRTTGCPIGRFTHVEIEAFTPSGDQYARHATELPQDCEFDVVYAGASYWCSDILRWNGVDLKPFTAEMRYIKPIPFIKSVYMGTYKSLRTS